MQELSEFPSAHDDPQPNRLRVFSVSPTKSKTKTVKKF